MTYVELTNNVIYNWGLFHIWSGGEGQYSVNSNYYKYGPNTHDEVHNTLFSEVNSLSKMYIGGNIMDGDDAVTADNWLGVLKVQDASSKLSEPPQVAGGYVPEPAQDAYNHVLSGAGATLPKRDAIDARVFRM